MPIRPSERARYPKDWKAISLRIREREGDRCKWCGVENRSEREPVRVDPLSEELGEPPHRVTVVLTVAHLDHTPENCADENLVALCQRCHLRYDAPLHQANAARTRRAKRRNGDLFAAPGTDTGQEG